MKILKVTLKQHTPLLHFQHEQYGATLRASEVKPKLDKYIVETLFKNDYEQCKSFLIGYKKETEKQKLNEALKKKFNEANFRGLDYKIKIQGIGDNKMQLNVFPRDYKGKFQVENFPLLLSNMGGNEDKSKLVNFSYYDSVSLCIMSKHEELIEKIEEIIASFFANTNWGQRCTKGFGSFTVKKINEKKKDWEPRLLLGDNTPYMKYSVKTNEIKRIQDLFWVIDFYWRCLKSGVNYTKRKIQGETITREKKERYVKSFLWTYLNTKGYTWEKRILKEELKLYGKCPEKKNTEPNVNKVFFARGLLGCPINAIKYMIPQGITFVNRDNRVKEKMDSVDVVISNDQNIERIASPIIFKPVFDNGSAFVYILFDQQLIKKLETLSNVNFSFKARGKTVILTLKAAINDGNDVFNINYIDLIKEFHAYFNYKMIARNHNWENILGNEEISFNY